MISKADLVFVPVEKLNDLKYMCGNHFRAEDRKKTRLKKMAIPSVGIHAEPLTDDFPLHIAVDGTTQSQPSDSSEPPTSGQINSSEVILKWKVESQSQTFLFNEKLAFTC